MSFCINCGTSLPVGAKFCPKCGMRTPLSNFNDQNKRNENQNKTINEMKCPNCGASINSINVTCPFCGIHVSDRKPSHSVSELCNKLYEIDSMPSPTKQESSGLAGFRLDRFLGLETTYPKASEKAKSKASLINSFPIPNTISEIMEFVIVADGSIDTDLSKNTFTNRANKLYQNDETVLSNAWVGKLQQAYNKANIMFPNDPLFVKIDQIYKKRMKELNIQNK